MYSGQIVESGGSTEVFRHPLHPYTRGLLDSIPKLDGEEQELSIISGEVQNLMDLPQGCFFSNRCGLAEARCRSTPQDLLDMGGARSVRCWKAKVG